MKNEKLKAYWWSPGENISWKYIELGNMCVVALNVKRRINRNYANMQFMLNTIYAKNANPFIT